MSRSLEQPTPKVFYGFRRDSGPLARGRRDRRHRGQSSADRGMKGRGMAGEIVNAVGPRPIAGLAQVRAYAPPADDAIGLRGRLRCTHRVGLPGPHAARAGAALGHGYRSCVRGRPARGRPPQRGRLCHRAGENDRSGIGRTRGHRAFWGCARPMDKALCRAVVDLSGRTSSSIGFGLSWRSAWACNCSSRNPRGRPALGG